MASVSLLENAKPKKVRARSRSSTTVCNSTGYRRFAPDVADACFGRDDSPVAPRHLDQRLSRSAHVLNLVGHILTLPLISARVKSVAGGQNGWTRRSIQTFRSKRKPLEISKFGELAQLVERVVRNDEVRGSIPLLSTIQLWCGCSRSDVLADQRASGSGLFYNAPTSRTLLSQRVSRWMTMLVPNLKVLAIFSGSRPRK